MMLTQGKVCDNQSASRRQKSSRQSVGRTDMTKNQIPPFKSNLDII